MLNKLISNNISLYRSGFARIESYGSIMVFLLYFFVLNLELASCCSKPDSLAVEGKMLALGTVLTWPKDIYGCRKSSTAPPNTTSTYTSQHAWVNPQSRAHFCPKLTQAANICVEARPAMMPTSVNGAVKQTSNVLPVKKFVSTSGLSLTHVFMQLNP